MFRLRVLLRRRRAASRLRAGAWGRRTRRLLSPGVRTQARADDRLLRTCWPTSVGKLNFMVYDRSQLGHDDSLEMLLAFSARLTSADGARGELSAQRHFDVTRGALGLLEDAGVGSSPAGHATSAKKWKARQKAAEAAAARAPTLALDEDGTIRFVPAALLAADDSATAPAAPRPAAATSASPDVAPPDPE